ncbi:MAG: hypothetical protein GQ526_04515 [Ardenticatenales bacterium]|nr:hypothetical protein [Ardenticatenales bacterium]
MDVHSVHHPRGAAPVANLASRVCFAPGCSRCYTVGRMEKAADHQAGVMDLREGQGCKTGSTRWQWSLSAGLLLLVPFLAFLVPWPAAAFEPIGPAQSWHKGGHNLDNVFFLGHSWASVRIGQAVGPTSVHPAAAPDPSAASTSLPPAASSADLSAPEFSIPSPRPVPICRRLAFQPEDALPWACILHRQ